MTLFSINIMIRNSPACSRKKRETTIHFGSRKINTACKVMLIGVTFSTSMYQIDYLQYAYMDVDVYFCKSLIFASFVLKFIETMLKNSLC